MKAICVIPARYASTRFPGKPLVDINGKSMIERVYKQACAVSNIDEVIVATDDQRIEDVVRSFNGKVVMTDAALPSGTDRVYRASQNISADVIVNLQGDEPFIKAQLLESLVQVFENTEIEIATPISKIDDETEFNNPNVVKVVKDRNGFALYFSRSQIPFLRDLKMQDLPGQQNLYKHVGIYAYRKTCLQKLTELKESSLEKTEKLEQLRFLENGYKIFTVLTDYKSISVDTPDDLEKIKKLIKHNELD